MKAAGNGGSQCADIDNYEKALQLGIAAGSASAFLSWLAGKDEIVKLLQQPPEEYGL